MSENIMCFVPFSAERDGRPYDGGAYIMRDATTGMFRWYSCTEPESKKTFASIEEAVEHFKRYVVHKRFNNVVWKEFSVASPKERDKPRMRRTK